MFRPPSDAPLIQLRDMFNHALERAGAEVLEYGSNEEATGWRVLVKSGEHYARLMLAPRERRWALTLDTRAYHAAIIDDVLEAVIDLVPFVLLSIGEDERLSQLVARLDRVTLHWARCEVYEVLTNTWVYQGDAERLARRPRPVGLVRWSGPCEVYRCASAEALRLEDGGRRGAQVLYEEDAPHAALLTVPGTLAVQERREVELVEVAPGEARRIGASIWIVRAGHWTYAVNTNTTHYFALEPARDYKDLPLDRKKTPGVLRLYEEAPPYSRRGVSKRWDDAPLLRTLDDAQRARLLSPIEIFASRHTSTAYVMGSDLDAMRREIEQWAKDQQIKGLVIDAYPLDTSHALEQGDLLFVREDERLVAYNVADILKNQARNTR